MPAAESNPVSRFGPSRQAVCRKVVGRFRDKADARKFAPAWSAESPASIGSPRCAIGGEVIGAAHDRLCALMLILKWRAPNYESGGQEFESLRARQFLPFSV
jgi:hypothetical protein